MHIPSNVHASGTEYFVLRISYLISMYSQFPNAVHLGDHASLFSLYLKFSLRFSTSCYREVAHGRRWCACHVQNRSLALGQCFRAKYRYKVQHTYLACLYPVFLSSSRHPPVLYTTASQDPAY